MRLHPTQKKRQIGINREVSLFWFVTLPAVICVTIWERGSSVQNADTLTRGPTRNAICINFQRKRDWTRLFMANILFLHATRSDRSYRAL